MKRLIPLILIALVLAACVAAPNHLQDQAGPGGKVAGFWLGLWHGFIILFTFIISLFNDKVAIYELYNNGGWYNFGFVLGAMMFWGSGGNRTAPCGRGKKEPGPIDTIKAEIRKEIHAEIEKELRAELNLDKGEKDSSEQKENDA